MQVVEVQRIQGRAGQAEMLHVKVHTCEGVAKSWVAGVASTAVAVGWEASCQYHQGVTAATRRSRDGEDRAKGKRDYNGFAISVPSHLSEFTLHAPRPLLRGSA